MPSLKRKHCPLPPPDAPYLTLPEVGALARGYDRAYRAVRTGRLRGHRPNGPGSDFIFKRSDVEAWLGGETADAVAS